MQQRKTDQEDEFSSTESSETDEEIIDTGVNIGDYITFGTYEQDNNISNGKEDIEWIVLEKEGDRLLLLSRYALETRAYDTEWDPFFSETCEWDTCDLREWLNDTFYRMTFSEEEKQQIVKTVLTNEAGNGNDITDWVFLLDRDIGKYRGHGYCYPTAYAIEQGAWTSDAGTCCWWQRDGLISFSSKNSWYSTWIFRDAISEGHEIDSDGICVRPAMWVNLE